MRFNHVGYGFYALILAYILMAGTVEAQTKVVVIGEQNFESGQVPNSDGWTFGGAVSVSTDTAQNFNNSKGSIKGSYPIPVSGGYVWGGLDIVSLNLSDVYVEFWAKMPNVKHGLKFLKIFGQRVDSGSVMNTANTTFGLDYTGVDYGAMYCVSYGDGSTVTNDTQNIILFDGTYAAGVGRALSKATVNTPQHKMWTSSNWGTSWHHFKFHLKYNTGSSAATEVANGEYYVEIDGVVYVDAKGLLNRHYSNKPIASIAFFDWSQTGKKAFDVWYDDIRITTGGFYNKGPLPPTNPSIITK